MKKNLPYFIIIAALILLIVGILFTGREELALIEPEQSAIMKAGIVEEEEMPFSLAEQGVVAETAPEQETVMPSLQKFFNVYTDKKAPDNHYAASGWMGDVGDLSLNDQYLKNPHSGATCIKITYSAKETQGAGWAGIYWQNPPNNWGETRGGFDLSGYNKLTFWARGKDGGEIIEGFKVGGIKGTYPDSLEVGIGPVILTKEWKEYTINLAGEDLSYVSGGFGWVTASQLNPDGAIFYLDDIRFEYEPGLQAGAKKAQEMPFNVYTERASAFNHFVPSGHMGDYGDLRVDEAWTTDPYSGTTCIKIVYSAEVSQGARWAGVYWQNPPNNWGQVKDAGYDLSRATKLTFWARGEKGGERIEEFKMGGISGDYPDSDTAGIGPVVLTQEWKQYTINLAGKDLSYVIGGFCWATNVDVNPEGAVFYLDDIKYE